MTQSQKVKVWDLPIRLFHWSLVFFFVLSYSTGEELDTVHAWSGYVITALLLFRLVWGLVGSRYARFSHFIYSRAEIVGYLKSLMTRSPRHYLGHNPAAGVMVFLMLASLSLTVWTGMEAYGAEGHGPLASTDLSLISTAYADGDHEDDVESEGEGSELWEELHEFFANFSLFLVFVHIGGVVVSSLVHRENLPRAMMNGYKQTR